MAGAIIETREIAPRWAPIVKMAIHAMDRESAAFHHLPYRGGVAEQPARTMEAFEVVQIVFAERLRDEYKRGTTKR